MIPTVSPLISEEELDLVPDFVVVKLPPVKYLGDPETAMIIDSTANAITDNIIS